ncbi:MAG: O-antigen ligase family protein [Gaiellaceae bacterium]
MSAHLTPNSFRWLVGGSVLAAGIGLLSTVDPRYAVAVAVATGGVALLGQRSEFVLPILVGSVFVEILSVGGVPISRLIAPLALLVVIATLSTERVRLVARGPMAWVTLYSIWAFASAFWTQSASGTTFQLSSLAIALIYLASFATLVRDERDVTRVLVAVAVAAFAIGLIALASFFLGYGDLKQGRTTGGTGDANFFAAYQVVALPLVLVLAATVRTRGRRLALYAVTLVIVASVLTSLSRGGVLTLATVLVLAAVVPARSLYRSRGQKALFITVIVAAGAFALATTAKELVPRIETVLVNKQETTSTGRGSGRVDLWLAARAAFVRHPFTGIGYGAFPSQSSELLLQTPGVNLQVNQVTSAGHEVHNAYLGTATELGIPGVTFFCGMLLSLAATLLRIARMARRRGNDYISRLAVALLISLTGWAVASVFLSSETSRVLWIMLGLSLSLPRLVEQPATHD